MDGFTVEELAWLHQKVAGWIRPWALQREGTRRRPWVMQPKTAQSACSIMPSGYTRWPKKETT
jgi:hypothetical protein